jgi:hypothetical protein
MKKVAAFLGVAAVAVVVSSAYAAWTVDEAGVGFVGKGDVQLALGLNNAQMQARAESLEFTYVDDVEYAVPCLKDNAAQTLQNTFKRKRGLDQAVDYDTRRTQQVNGFRLKGFEGEGEIAGEPACPGGWEANGEPVLVGAGGGLLYVDGVALDAAARY